MSIQSVYEKSISAVVCISSGNGRSFSISSGFLIDQYHIVTCCHCVYETTGVKNRVVKVYVDVKGSKVVDAEVIGVDGTADVAVLRLKTPIPGTTTLRWAKKIDRGEQCVLIGAPYGDVQSVSNAYVRDTSFYGSSLLPTVMESILIDGSALGGNSGGPLINLKGEVVGILAYGYSGVVGGTMNGAVPFSIVAPIVSWIISNKKNYPFGTLGVQVSPMYIDDILYLDLNKIQGYMVTDVYKTGNSLGIVEGDIITHVLIGGKDYEVGQLNSQSCIFSLIHMNARAPIQLKMKRNGKNFILPVTIPSGTSTIPQNAVL